MNWARSRSAWWVWSGLARTLGSAHPATQAAYGRFAARAELPNDLRGPALVGYLRVLRPGTNNRRWRRYAGDAEPWGPKVPRYA